MIKVYLTRGLPGSGKDYWAENIIKARPNAYKRINKDLLREMFDFSKHSDDAEKFVLKARDQFILLAIEEGKHVLVTDTNLAPKHKARIRQLVHGKAEVEIIDFTDVSIETCIKRDLQRQKSVGEKVIREMYNKFLRPKVNAPKVDFSLPFAIICDLDGTLALLNGRSPYDASTCENDIINQPIANLLFGKQVILVSGREDKYRKQTKNFLKKHKISSLLLYMRPTGDNRKDCIIKQEIYNNHIKGKYNIEFVLDDRNQVVEMWRNNGLTCLQVADGNF